MKKVQKLGDASEEDNILEMLNQRQGDWMLVPKQWNRSEMLELIQNVGMGARSVGVSGVAAWV
jgi:hypothetical protein